MRSLIVATLSDGRATNTWLKLTDVPGVGAPTAQLGPFAFVRRLGRNRRYSLLAK